MLEGGAAHGSCKDVFQWISVCLGSKASGKTSIVFYFFLTNIYQKKPKLTNITFLLLFSVALEVFMLSFNTGMDSWLPY